MVFKMVKEFIAKKTIPIRHRIVKLIAPKLYEDFLIYKNIEFPRPMIKYISKKFGNAPLTGVEIGVGFGENAKSILKTLNMKMLCLIDPYEPYYEYGIDMSGYVKGLEIVEKELAILLNVKFIKKRSEDAMSDVPNNLDFVYIDGCHEYEFVKKDIELYYPKIREGGIIGGHDF